MSKSAYDILSDIEYQTVELQRAVVLLNEASNYNDDLIDPESWKARYFLTQAKPVISVLIDVASRLVRGTLPVLDEAANELLEMHKQRKDSKNETTANN